MRDALQALVGVPDHLALAYDAWAPVGPGGKVADAARAGWFAKLENLAICADYPHAFARWRSSFGAPGDRCVEVELASRLLVGHGNTSATDVGLTVHHTWGVPLLPGSALKGLLAHYVDAAYGPDRADLPPWDQSEAELERAGFQGVTWRGRRIARGPGEVYRALFGSPDAEQDAAMRERGLEAGASAGLVAFYDALYVPDSAPDGKPFAADVLTVHQKEYYDTSGGTWPNDYDSPNPVAFLTVRPGTRLLLVLTGPAAWTELAERLLFDALAEWGVGGKTSAGYGRLVRATPRPAAATGGHRSVGRERSRPPRAGERVEAVLLEERTKKGGWKARHEPSGLTGPIQNSGDVPSTMNTGDRVELVVAISKGAESAFKYPTGGR